MFRTKRSKKGKSHKGEQTADPYFHIEADSKGQAKKLDVALQMEHSAVYVHDHFSWIQVHLPTENEFETLRNHLQEIQIFSDSSQKNKGTHQKIHEEV
mgnify:CR=1 FL=1